MSEGVKLSATTGGGGENKISKYFSYIMKQEFKQM